MEKGLLQDLSTGTWNFWKNSADNLSCFYFFVNHLFFFPPTDIMENEFEKKKTTRFSDKTFIGNTQLTITINLEKSVLVAGLQAAGQMFASLSSWRYYNL